MGTRFLLDTNTVIYYTKNDLSENAAAFLDTQIYKGVFLSVISEIELLGWQFPSVETETIMETFINGCYDYTRSVSGERKWYIDQFARWVDFDHSYKTMDNDYMESVRRVFKTLWDK